MCSQTVLILSGQTADWLSVFKDNRANVINVAIEQSARGPVFGSQPNDASS